MYEYSTSCDVSVKTISEAKVYFMIHIGEFYHYSTSCLDLKSMLNGKILWLVSVLV